MVTNNVSVTRKTVGYISFGSLILLAPIIGGYYVYGNDIRTNKEQIAKLDTENATEHQEIIKLIPNKDYLDLRFRTIETNQTELSQDIRALTQEIRNKK